MIPSTRKICEAKERQCGPGKAATIACTDLAPSNDGSDGSARDESPSQQPSESTTESGTKSEEHSNALNELVATVETGEDECDSGDDSSLDCRLKVRR